MVTTKWKFWAHVAVILFKLVENWSKEWNTSLVVSLFPKFSSIISRVPFVFKPIEQEIWLNWKCPRYDIPFNYFKMAHTIIQMNFFYSVQPISFGWNSLNSVDVVIFKFSSINFATQYFNLYYTRLHLQPSGWPILANRKHPLHVANLVGGK